MAAKKTSSIFASLKNDLEAQKAEDEKNLEEESTLDALEFDTEEDSPTAKSTETPAPKAKASAQPVIENAEKPAAEIEKAEKNTAPAPVYEEVQPQVQPQPAKKTSILAGAKNRTVRVPRSLALTQEADEKIQMLKKKYDLSLNEIINRIILAYED